MFNADLVLPGDLYRLAQQYPNKYTFDFIGFKLINVKRADFLCIAEKIAIERMMSLSAIWNGLLDRSNDTKLAPVLCFKFKKNELIIPAPATEKISDYLGVGKLQKLQILF